MKLVMLMYLKEDTECVEGLLRELEVPVFSRLPVEGVGPGVRGWYGKVPPYASGIAFAVVPDDLADRILAAVRAQRGLQDVRHPVHALQLPVEEEAVCRVP